MVQKRNLTQAKIVDQALIIANDKGLDQLTFPILAAGLNIKYPSLYNHFPNIQAVKDAMVVRIYLEMNIQLTTQLANLHGSNAVMCYAEIYRNVALKYAGSFDLVTNYFLKEDSAVGQVLRTHYELLRGTLVDFDIPTTDLVLLNRGLRSMITGFISLSIKGYFGKEFNLSKDETYHQLIMNLVKKLPLKG
ncbi:TetR/AcrR family transcriptional regulator [Periweissella cryptocerci]|uniref:TetR/AcrR family transcriptional regulator n=1 Tax=Periweissella cryptocerci TaxID=2506420 RepID=A0A4P6YVU1_9LACO|nr:TetR/AcrR family transcriptional regulator [Periweissella cryptocerci]QBO36847.1 TetR/AcrR family transcriptional regulator [Periweissella cryptocerci]